MNREDLLKEMKNSIGAKEPVVFFGQMVDVFNLLFNRIDDLEKSLERIQLNTVMAICWEPRIAADMIAKEIEFCRKTGKDPLLIGNIYADEINILQSEYMGGHFSKDYETFCKFWQDTLGYHPFLEERK